MVSLSAFQSSVNALEQLRSVKSEVEGSHVKFEKVHIDKTILQVSPQTFPEKYFENTIQVFVCNQA